MPLSVIILLFVLFSAIVTDQICFISKQKSQMNSKSDIVTEEPKEADSEQFSEDCHDGEFQCCCLFNYEWRCCPD